MAWHERIVYQRDFAYDARRSRMANGSIGQVPAATFAEYVDAPFLDHREAGDDEEEEGDDDDDDDDNVNTAPQAVVAHERPASASRCIALRPSLTHRLYSHRLHVRAKAKWQRDRLLSGPLLDVHVGPSRRHWALHRNLLCHHSEHLNDELLRRSEDGSDKANLLELPDHDPAGFELLVTWLYQGRLDDVSDMADAMQKYDYAVSCHKLYLLCDRFNMTQLKNAAMDQYRKGLHQAKLVPDADEMDSIYRQSPPASPFRHLITRIAARQIMDPDSERDIESYRLCFENNPDFALDLVKAIRRGSGGLLLDDPTNANSGCDYHDHEASSHCESKKNGRPKINGKVSTKPEPPTPTYQNSHQRHPPRKLKSQTSPPLSPPSSPKKTSPLDFDFTSRHMQSHRTSNGDAHNQPRYDYTTARSNGPLSAPSSHSATSGREPLTGKKEEGQAETETETETETATEVAGNREGEGEEEPDILFSPRRAPMKLKR